MKLTVTKKNKIKTSVDKKLDVLEEIPEDLHEFFRAATPVLSGNARKKTLLKNGNKIVGDYPYAVKLDNGFSDKAPDGMTKPTDAYFKRRMDAIFKRK